MIHFQSAEFLTISLLLFPFDLSCQRAGSPTTAAPDAVRSRNSIPWYWSEAREPYTLAGLRIGHERIAQHSGAVVLVSFFGNGDLNQKSHCYIRADGDWGGVSYVKNWAVHGGFLSDEAVGTPMPKAQRSALDAAISRLPGSQPFARDSDALIVSWEASGRWMTRTYNRTKLPPEVLQFCDLAHVYRTWL